MTTPTTPSTPTTEAMGRVVVGVDDSPGSAAALAWAIEEAAYRNAELDVVNGWFPSGAVLPLWAVPEQPWRVDDFEADAKHLIDTMIGVALTHTTRRPPVIEPQPVRAGPAAALLEAAKGADLLIVGSRGRGGFKGLLLGSVSLQCVSHAPCPVVVVRPPE